MRTSNAAHTIDACAHGSAERDAISSTPPAVSRPCDAAAAAAPLTGGSSPTRTRAECGCAKTRRQPRTRTSLKLVRLGKVSLADFSESSAPYDMTVMQRRGTRAAASTVRSREAREPSCARSVARSDGSASASSTLSLPPPPPIMASAPISGCAPQTTARPPPTLTAAAAMAPCVPQPPAYASAWSAYHASGSMGGPFSSGTRHGPPWK
mmetsp:Transcript_10197/g.26482  ORF Transcript_10197/g.26482 Transcript_10197/m.26482 type:complete len:209 (-) Transcript_10197:619-1245(-)